MRLSQVAAVSAAFLSEYSVLAAPVPREIRETFFDPFEIATLGGNTFKFQQTANKNFGGYRKGRGAVSLARAYSKFGIDVPDSLLSIIEELLEELGLLSQGGGKQSNSTANPAGDVTATPQMFDSEYLCPVQIGTPAQTLSLDFDTGSSDLWVFSSETPASQIEGQTLYEIGQSSTAKQLVGESWAISYGDGSSSSGNVYEDVVSIGGITVQNQAVESATNVSTAFTQRTDTDGLVGLAFSTLNTVSPQQQLTFFDNAMADLASPLFTANLKASEPGNYNFGFIDPSEFTGDITYVPVNTSSGFWQFAAEGYEVGSSGAVSDAHQAIADTGTTLIIVPQDIVTAYYAQVSGAENSESAGGYIFPCSATLPDYTVVIGGHAATVPASFLNYAPVDGTSFADATTCYGGIQAASADFPFAIYGDVFLKSQFVVFHGGNAELGFAAKPT
ncbi:eukaryotic aspartyl protease [Xylariaceae sp. FL0255]|nr:eukaryotic aspartyl protease [Xylariaceae sp. FL0255]